MGIFTSEPKLSIQAQETLVETICKALLDHQFTLLLRPNHTVVNGNPRSAQQYHTNLNPEQRIAFPAFEEFAKQENFYYQAPNNLHYNNEIIQHIYNAIEKLQTLAASPRTASVFKSNGASILKTLIANVKAANYKAQYSKNNIYKCAYEQFLHQVTFYSQQMSIFTGANNSLAAISEAMMDGLSMPYTHFMELISALTGSNVAAKEETIGSIALDWGRNKFKINNNPSIEHLLNGINPSTQATEIYQRSLAYIQSTLDVSNLRAKQIFALTNQHAFSQVAHGVLANLSDKFAGKKIIRPSTANDASTRTDIYYHNNEISFTLSINVEEISFITTKTRSGYVNENGEKIELDPFTGMSKPKNLFKLTYTINLRWLSNEDSMPLLSDFEYQFDACESNIRPDILQMLIPWQILLQHKHEIIRKTNDRIINRFDAPSVASSSGLGSSGSGRSSPMSVQSNTTSNMVY